MTDEEIEKLADEFAKKIGTASIYNNWCPPDLGSANIEVVYNLLMKTFIAGFRACQEQQKWISVKERLPEEYEIVLCYGAIEYRDQTVFNVEPGKRYTYKIIPTNTIEERWVTLNYDGIGGCEYFGVVSHWMPLPEAPDVEGEE